MSATRVSRTIADFRILSFHFFYLLLLFLSILDCWGGQASGYLVECLGQGQSSTRLRALFQCLPAAPPMFLGCMEFARLLNQNQSLDLLTEVGTQCERAVIVQLLVTGPPHGIAHALDLNLRSKLQSFPICDVRKHELSLPDLAG
jgi:hypothetical protein